MRSIDERTCDFECSKVANFLEYEINHLPGVHYMGDHIDDNERGKKNAVTLLQKMQVTLISFVVWP